MKLPVPLTNATFLAFREVNKRVGSSLNWQLGTWVCLPTRLPTLGKMMGGKHKPIILGADKNATLDLTVDVYN
jgi:hypothetical protein